MSGKNRTEAWDRTRKAADQIKPMAAQMKPLAKSTGQAAQRQWFRARAWAGPQVERTGKALQDTVAPKVSDLLSSAAERIDPAKIDPAEAKRGRWRLPVGIAAVVAAAASGAAAFLRKRSKTQSAASAEDINDINDMSDMSDMGESGESGESGDVGQAKTEPIAQDKQAHVG
jgi:hypothetical protein